MNECHKRASDCDRNATMTATGLQDLQGRLCACKCGWPSGGWLLNVSDLKLDVKTAC
jgi:hypothetical protein